MSELLNNSALRNTGKVLRTQTPQNKQLDSLTNVDEYIKLCFAPSELFGAKIAAGFGYIAEPFIGFRLKSYFRKNNIADENIYNDYSFEGAIDTSYVSFLVNKNPFLTPGDIADLENNSRSRPDILIHEDTLKEFYEIKPNSPSGRSAGREKIKALESDYTKFKLPYTKGPDIELDDITLGRFDLVIQEARIPVEISFSFEVTNGLILYRLCIKTKWKWLLQQDAILDLIKGIMDYMRQIIKDIRNKVKQLASDVKLPELEPATVAIIVAVILFLLFLPEIVGGAIVLSALVVAELEAASVVLSGIVLQRLATSM
ncbi:MAG: hypothetical protein JST26_07685 [Bacteroidetes bacterium]|nr:hypothetical protein [Bacteroidota bacterium]